MKKLILSGLLGLSAIALMGNNGHKAAKRLPAFVFTDLPSVSVMDEAVRASYLRAVVPMTIIIVGSGGTDPVSGIVCPNQTYEKCATIVTAFVQGNWGPGAQVEETATGQLYNGVIDSPIEDQNGNVVNFRFSSLEPIN